MTLIGKWLTDDGEWMLRIENGSQKLYLYVRTPDNLTTVGLMHPQLLETGVWYFVYAYHDEREDELSVSINNGPATTAAYSAGVRNETHAFYLGRQVDGKYFDGQLDEWAIWSRVLTEEEKDYLYNDDFGRTYPFDGSPPPLPSGWLDNEYAYGGSQPHAVTSVERIEGLDEYAYDANGNMTTRLEAGVEWTQTFNAENRLANVSNGTDTWTFVYDGDGNRVNQINPDGTVTLFLGGGLYTVEDAAGTPQVTKYYSIVGQRVAMADGSGVKYLLTDHLGSVVGVTNAAGALVQDSEQRYLPFGEARLGADAPTDFGFTGQRGLADVGLMDYWRTGLRPPFRDNGFFPVRLKRSAVRFPR